MKTKVGIITFHRANNYGAALQCYALQETLTSIGYDVVVIDYRQPYIEMAYNPIRWDILERVKIEFDKAGINIPYNQLDVHLVKDGE